MQTIHKEIDIQRPVDQVFAYIDDPYKTLEWLPSLLEVRNVSGEGVGQSNEWTYKMAGLKLDGESRCTAHQPNERRVVETKGGVDGKWTFIFEPRDDQTHLDVTIEYEVPVPVLGKLAEKLIVRRNERELELAVQNIKEHCES